MMLNLLFVAVFFGLLLLGLFRKAMATVLLSVLGLAQQGYYIASKLFG